MGHLLGSRYSLAEVHVGFSVGHKSTLTPLSTARIFALNLGFGNFATGACALCGLQRRLSYLLGTSGLVRGCMLKVEPLIAQDRAKLPQRLRRSLGANATVC